MTKLVRIIGRAFAALVLLFHWGGTAAHAGPTVYTAGYLLQDRKTRAFYLEGATLTFLGDGIHHSLAKSIAVSEGTVYTLGSWLDETRKEYIPCYWVGTKRVDLDDGTRTGSALGIAVSEGTVYTAGSWYDGTRYILCYWVGTTRVDLDHGKHAGEALAIAVP